ncbi:MAG: type II toxin-antitoxin system RelE family toxin [Desulfocucumaceae bacterium]
MYTIRPLKRRIREQINKLPPTYKEGTPEAFQDIERNPRHHPLGKITPFKGDLAYLGWHYDLSWSYRIHYKIIENTKEIEITYVGGHPKY